MGSNIITKYHYRAFKKDNGKFKQCKFVNYKMQSEKKTALWTEFWKSLKIIYIPSLSINDN